MELNFDGLTDAITNLAGALILLVVLLIGLTRSVVEEPEEVVGATPAAEPPPAVEQAAGDRTLESLLETVQTLRARIAHIDREIKDIEEQRLPELRQRAEKLAGRGT